MWVQPTDKFGEDDGKPFVCADGTRMAGPGETVYWEASREAAFRIRSLNEADTGGTFQARFERNAFDEALVKRLEELELGASDRRWLGPVRA